MGEVFARPDLAVVTFSVVNEARNVTEALAGNTTKMNAVIDAVKKQGVDSKDLKTTNFNIYPRYEYIGTEAGKAIYPPQGRRVLVGYEVNQSLEVKIRNLDKVGNIIQTATDAGANELGGLYFTIDNQDALQKEARQKAIQEAKNKAKDIAQDLGVNLARIVNFNESGFTPIRYMADYETAKGMGGGVPQIETGENKISASVSITYEIN